MARKTSKIFAECRQNFSPWVLHNNCTRRGEGGGVDPDENWKCELNRWEKVSPAISEVHCKKGEHFSSFCRKKFPYLRRSGDEEMIGKIPA
jgi:hypothetical protein